MALAALAAVFVFAGAASSQRVDGRIVDSTSGAPVSGAHVQLIAGDSSVLGSAMSDTRGALSVDARGGAAVYIRVVRLGYRDVRAPLAELQQAGQVVTIALEAVPVALPEVPVEGERQNRFLRGVGSYERQRAGFGTFLTREMMEEKYPTARRMSDVLRTLPGTVVKEDENGVVVGFFRSMLRTQGPCAARFYLNGTIISDPFPNFRPAELEAIEIYPGAAQIPAQYGGAEAACGVILVWLRTGQS